MIKMFGVLLSVVLVCIMTGHVSCRNLTASPNYVHSGTQLTLTCDVGESIVNGTATFRSSSGSLGSITYDHMNNCYVNSSSTPCSSTCSCEENNNRMIWKYTQSSTPSSNQTFYCDFIGDSGPFTTSTTVKRAVIPLPTISPSNSSYTVKIGGQLQTIKCTETCWPSCDVKWTGPNGFSDNSDSLKLAKIEKTNSGRYRCQVHNVVGYNNGQIITVEVQYGPDNMAFVPPATSYSKTKGSIFESINCSADCVPSCKFQWIYPNDTIHVGNVLPQHIIQKKHHGLYKCNASNDIATDEKNIQVYVNYAPEDIRLSPAGNEFFANEFSYFDRVNCSADCSPSCQYQWFGPKGWSIANDRLQLSAIRRTAAGSYRCSVQNAHGTIQSSNINIIVNTKPTQVDKMTVVCTGATTASIAWIPDKTVVPGEKFTVNYTTNSGQIHLFSFEEPSTKDDIYLLQVDSLVPSTEYTFTMESKNGLGLARSNEYRCTTMAASEESEVSGALIGGIVLISIALLLIIIVIAFILLRKFRILTTDLSTLPCACPNCITTCIQRISRLSKKDEGPYMNTVHTNYVNTTINGPQEGNVNTEVTNDDIGSDKPYDDLVRRTSNSSEKPYDNLHMSPTGTQNDPTSHYANYENVKKIKNKKEKMALKPPPVKKTKPKKKFDS